MLTPLRRRLAAAAPLLLVLFVPSLAACGFNYQTDKVYQPAVGVNNRSGNVDVLGAVVVSGTDGSGTFVATLVNKASGQPATLTGLTGPAGTTTRFTAPVQVQPGALVNLADAGAVAINGDAVKAGGWVRLTLEFQDGQTTKVNAPVVDRTGEFSQVSPAMPSSSSTP